MNDGYGRDRETGQTLRTCLPASMFTCFPLTWKLPLGWKGYDETNVRCCACSRCTAAGGMCTSWIRCAASSAEQALTPIKLGVGFIPSVQFAPFYVGIEKGFFAEQGLELSLDHGFENDYLKLVGTGETQFMVGSGDQVVLGRAQGAASSLCDELVFRLSGGRLSRQEAGLTEPGQLKGANGWGFLVHLGPLMWPCAGFSKRVALLSKTFKWRASASPRLPNQPRHG